MYCHAHLLHIEVKVFPTTDDAQRFKKLKKVILDTGREELSLEIQGVKFFKHIIGTRLHNIFQSSEFFSFICHNLHANHICNVILVFFKA